MRYVSPKYKCVFSHLCIDLNAASRAIQFTLLFIPTHPLPPCVKVVEHVVASVDQEQESYFSKLRIHWFNSGDISVNLQVAVDTLESVAFPYSNKTSGFCLLCFECKILWIPQIPWIPWILIPPPVHIVRKPNSKFKKSVNSADSADSTESRGSPGFPGF